MKDMKVDVLRTNPFTPFKQEVYGGIVPEHPNYFGDVIDYFRKISITEEPETFVVITSKDISSSSAPIVTRRFTYNTPYGVLDYDNSLINKITESDFIGIDNNAFERGDIIDNFVPNIKNVFPEARVVPLIITSNADLQDIFLLSRRLKEAVNSHNKLVFVLGLTDFSLAGDQNIVELQNATAERVINNFELSHVNNLAVSSKKTLKTLLYYFGAQNARVPFFTHSREEIYVYFTEISEEYIPEVLNRVTLLGFGDVMLDRQVRALMNQNGLFYPFEKIAGPENHFMEGADFIFANLEGPIKEVYVPTSKSISFRFRPDIVAVLKQAGITIVSIANNHALDQGWAGRGDTMRFLSEGGIAYFGHPKNEFEENVYETKVADSKIAFIGFDDTIFKIDAEKTAEYIRILDTKNDYVIISIHWGREYVHTPTKRKIDLAHTFADAGADLIIGHHPHVVQTMEIYNDVPIFYSLGNFVFDQYFSLDTQEGLSIGVIMEKDQMVVYLFPYKIPRSQPTLMNAEEKAAFLDKFISWGNYSDELTESIRKGKIIMTHD